MTGFIGQDPLNDLTNLNQRPVFVQARRSPTSQDRYPPGTEWGDGITPIQNLYITPNDGIWNLIATSGSPLTTINGVASVAANIDLINEGGVGALTVTAPGSGGAGTVGLGVNVDGVTVQIVGNQLVATAGAIDITPNTGVNVTNPTFSLLGTQVAAGADPVQTNGTVANSLQIEVQRSQATAGSTLTANGLAHFDSAMFTVDANGYVQLLGVVSGVAQTIGAVTADVITFDMGAIAGTRGFDITIAAFEAGTPLAATYSVISAVRTTGLAATVGMGAIDVTTAEEPGLAAASVTIVTVGNNAIIQVTGVAGLTIEWSAILQSTFAS